MNILESKRLKKMGMEMELPKSRSLLSQTLRISMPAGAEIFLIGCISMADTMMVGGIGKEAIAAVNITQQPVFMTLALCMGLTSGVTAIVARRMGEKDKEGANRVLRQSIILGAIFAAIVTILSYFLAEPLLYLAGAKSETIGYATDYFRIVSIALVFNYVRLVMCAAQRACGNTHITLIVNVTANLVNIFFNYCMIGGNFGFPKWEVKGAAVATVIGNFVGFVITILSVYKNKGFLTFKIKDDWRFDKKTLSNIVNISSGSFIEQMFMRVGFFISARIVNDLGTYSTAVNTITSSVISLSFNIADGFSIGAASLVGKSLGEKRTDVAYAYGRMSQMVAVSISVLMLIATIAFRKPLSMAFISDDMGVVEDSAKLLLFGSLVIIPQSLQWITTGILRGAGDTKFTAVVSFGSVLFLRPLFSWILCYPIGLGLMGSWLGMIMDQSIRFMANNIRFTRLKWAKIKV